MSVSRFDFLERFLDATDFVASGRTFAISDDKWLLNNYENSFFSVVEKHLKNSDARIRADVIRFFTKVKERTALDAVKEMRIHDNDIVRTACAGYLDTLDETNNMISSLFDILEHDTGQEFGKAAWKLGSIGRSEDILRLRRTYGQVNGDMKEQIRKALVCIINKDENLKKNKELILSEPMFPNEEKFLSFLDKAVVYIDIRYRDSIAPKNDITGNAYENVRDAIKKIRVRLYNEYDNLRYYGSKTKRMYDELLEMTEWASEDLSSKIINSEQIRKNEILCAKCGNETVVFNGVRTCIGCGNRKKQE